MLYRPVGVYQNGLPERSAKIYAHQNARKICLSGQSATMTYEQWRTKLRRRQNRCRQPPLKLARASSIAAGAPRGDAHI
jgi:hypothetical protein